jgi:cyclase
MEEIAPGVYVSTFYPGINVGLVCTDEGAVVVDAPPLPADARSWQERVLKVAGGPIRYAVLTDDHPDRLLGTGWMNAPVIAGRGSLQRLRDGGEALWRSAVEDWVRRHGGAEQLARARPVLPEIAVVGRVTIHSSPPVLVESVSGATAGSVSVLLPEHGVLFAGDTVVSNAHPSLTEAPDTRAWLETLVEVRRARFAASIIVPGRGPVGDKDSTRPLSEYIQLARRRIRSVHASGGGRGDLVELVAEFLPLFPVEAENREWVQRQIRAGLEHVLEELRPA